MSNGPAPSQGSGDGSSEIPPSSSVPIEDHHKDDDEYDIDWETEQELPTALMGAERYGFNMQYQGN